MSDRYDVIVVDPPWSYGQAGRPRTAEAHYSTLGRNGKEIHRRTGAGTEAIVAALPLMPLWLGTPSLLCLWTTNPKLPFAFGLLAQWGATYQTCVTWVKTTRTGALAFGQGWYFRGCSEHLLIGTVGSFRIAAALRPRNVVLARRARHSEKPQAMYDLIVGATPNCRRLDVFARQQRDGWEAWGHEAPVVRQRAEDGT